MSLRQTFTVPRTVLLLVAILNTTLIRLAGTFFAAYAQVKAQSQTACEKLKYSPHAFLEETVPRCCVHTLSSSKVK